eukprot:CAMPEP_0174759146 /NCGR_PEP_ID=MMETSP1094-20130205/108123_1 /TAXON_ID=156173 /ORGANISM="Chrysochromulina brevifilum, Strain UTEX LB 985" /LENGTH=75 /DNA_ID=CAMNT_0015965079 /DNA_START=366 /DNA_END=593 /DNA_ORIENTATION=-
MATYEEQRVAPSSRGSWTRHCLGSLESIQIEEPHKGRQHTRLHDQWLEHAPTTRASDDHVGLPARLTQRDQEGGE